MPLIIITQAVRSFGMLWDDKKCFIPTTVHYKVRFRITKEPLCKVLHKVCLHLQPGEKHGKSDVNKFPDV